MDDATSAPGGRPPGSRPGPATARERLAAAVRDDARGPGPRPAEEPLPQLPPEEGLEPVRRLGVGAWLVRETRSREVFVLRPCTGADDAERAASRRALLVLAVDLAGREDPRLVAVRGLLGPAAEPVGLVEEYLPDGSLAQRLAERGPLAADEAAAVLRDAAAGLAALHGLGRCHGELTARQILFRRTATGGGPGNAAGTVAGPEDGSGGTARAVVRPGTGDGSPPEDVRALGVVGWTALTGRAPAAGRHRAPLARLRPDVPAPLRRAVESALAEHPADRPGAAQLAAALELLPTPGPAAPAAAGRSSRRAGPGPTAARSSRRTARGPAGAPPSRRTAISATAAALVLATGTALLWPRPESRAPDAAAPHPPAASTGSAGASGTTLPGPELPDPAASAAHVPGAADPAAGDRMEQGEPQEALRRLVARRGEALRTGDARLLDRVYVPGAAAAAEDRATIARAAAGRDRVFADLALETGRIRGAAPRPGPTVAGGVALEAEVRVEGYRGEPGPGLSVLPAGEGWVQTVVVVLVRGEEGWRLAAVEPRRERPTGPATPDPRR